MSEPKLCAFCEQTAVFECWCCGAPLCNDCIEVEMIFEDEQDFCPNCIEGVQEDDA